MLFLTNQKINIGFCMRLIVAFLFLPILAAAQTDEAVSIQKTEQMLNRFLKPEALEVLPSTQRVTKFFSRLDTHRDAYDQHQQQFVRQLFVKTHSRFLKTFKDNATFSQLFSNGNYNCLTATALLGVALQHFNYSFRIVETNHHIFILVDTDHGTALLETTDPIDGFTTNQKEIDKRIAAYKAATASETTSRVIQYEFKTRLFKEVTLGELTGLLHFNLAANAYNARNYEQVVDQLEKSASLYWSSRLKEFSDLIILTLNETKAKNGPALVTRLHKLRPTPADIVVDTKF
jgi:hypothetical protein